MPLLVVAIMTHVIYKAFANGLEWGSQASRKAWDASLDHSRSLMDRARQRMTDTLDAWDRDPRARRYAATGVRMAAGLGKGLGKLGLGTLLAGAKATGAVGRALAGGAIATGGLLGSLAGAARWGTRRGAEWWNNNHSSRRWSWADWWNSKADDWAQRARGWGSTVPSQATDNGDVPWFPGDDPAEPGFGPDPDPEPGPVWPGTGDGKSEYVLPAGGRSFNPPDDTSQGPSETASRRAYWDPDIDPGEENYNPATDPNDPWEPTVTKPDWSKGGPPNPRGPKTGPTVVEWGEPIPSQGGENPTTVKPTRVGSTPAGIPAVPATAPAAVASVPTPAIEGGSMSDTLVPAGGNAVAPISSAADGMQYEQAQNFLAEQERRARELAALAEQIHSMQLRLMEAAAIMGGDHEMAEAALARFNITAPNVGHAIELLRSIATPAPMEAMVSTYMALDGVATSCNADAANLTGRFGTAWETMKAEQADGQFLNG